MEGLDPARGGESWRWLCYVAATLRGHVVRRLTGEIVAPGARRQDRENGAAGGWR